MDRGLGIQESLVAKRIGDCVSKVLVTSKLGAGLTKNYW